MDILTTIILGVIGVVLVLSLLGGLIKGTKRSILRLILVVLSFVIVFVAKDDIVNAILATEVDGLPLVDFVKSKLPEELSSMTDIIIPLLTALICVITFVVGFLAMMVVSWILYLVLCIFVKKKFKSGKKGAFVGMLVGIVQGAVIAVGLTTPIIGLVTDLAPATEIKFQDFDVSEMIPESIDLKAFSENNLVKTDLKLTGKIYEELSTVTIDGKEYTINSQVAAIAASAKIANELMSLTELDFSGGLDASSAEDIQNIFNKLDEINGELTPETQEVITEMITTVVDSFAESLPEEAQGLVDIVAGLDLSKVNFAEEGEIVTDLMGYVDGTTPVEEMNISTVVDNLANSTLILPVIAEMDIAVELDGTQKTEAQQAIDNLPDDVSEETINSLKALLGLAE